MDAIQIKFDKIPLTDRLTLVRNSTYCMSVKFDDKDNLLKTHTSYKTFLGRVIKLENDTNKSYCNMVKHILYNIYSSVPNTIAVSEKNIAAIRSESTIREVDSIIQKISLYEVADTLNNRTARKPKQAPVENVVAKEIKQDKPEIERQVVVEKPVAVEKPVEIEKPTIIEKPVQKTKTANKAKQNNEIKLEDITEKYSSINSKNLNKKQLQEYYTKLIESRLNKKCVYVRYDDLPKVNVTSKNSNSKNLVDTQKAHSDELYGPNTVLIATRPSREHDFLHALLVMRTKKDSVGTYEVDELIALNKLNPISLYIVMSKMGITKLEETHKSGYNQDIAIEVKKIERLMKLK